MESNHKALSMVIVVQASALLLVAKPNNLLHLIIIIKQEVSHPKKVVAVNEITLICIYLYISCSIY